MVYYFDVAHVVESGLPEVWKTMVDQVGQGSKKLSWVPVLRLFGSVQV